MKSYALDGCRIQLDDPVLVAKAAGHHWFPTLHRVNGQDILCEVITTADVAQGKWPAVLYLSRDAGRSWHKALEIESFGHSSVALSPRKILIMPYELWPLSPGDYRNAKADGTIVTCLDDGAVTAEPAPVQFLDFPGDLDKYHVDELNLMANGNILPLNDGRLLMTLYGRFGTNKEQHQNDCMAVISDDGGFTWRYVSHVGRWEDTPGASEGPDESNSARLPDGRLMCVYRVGSGRQYHYHVSYSSDEGQSWTTAKRMSDQWSVEPALVCLENGVLLLAGGRPGLMLWVSADGSGDNWQPINLAEHHNASGDRSLHFEAECVKASGEGTPAHTTSYTCMRAIGPAEAMISYDRLGNGWDGAPGPRGPHDAVFTVRVRIGDYSRQSG